MTASYTTEEILHIGPISTVYMARHVQSGRRIVIKSLHAEYPSSSDLALLQNEFDITQFLEPYGFRKVIEFSQFSGRPALFLEYLPGVPLSLLPTPVSIDFFLSLALPLVAQLVSIHWLDVFHRDIKPHNILFNAETKRLEIIDFSLGQHISRRKNRQSHLDLLEGSLPYMSPEQTGRMNLPIDHRTDLYSLGVVFYQLLTGHLPFEATDAMGWIYAHMTLIPKTPHAVVPSVPREISDVIVKLLSKSPEQRYQSAEGLLFDLQTCKDIFEGKISLSGTDFVLAQRDVDSQFSFPAQLYGRDREIAQLLSGLDRAVNVEDTVTWAMVSGYAGIGKTELVQELQKRVAHYQGHFVTGKFEPHDQSTPFSGLISAFKSLIKHILSEGETDITAWKHRVSTLLGHNSAVLVQIVPELEWLIGRQERALDLPTAENEHRFRQAFREMVRAFSTVEHPLVLFLDNLQWVDPASLQLIQELSQIENIEGVMVIGAYRDHEVMDSHPLLDTLTQMEEHHVEFLQLRLQPLTEMELEKLFSDMLKCTVDRAKPLAHLLHKKTGGNPFFIQQFVYLLYEDGILNFDRYSKQWVWDLDVISAIGFTDNVIDLMVHALEKFPPDTLDVLQWASVWGQAFDIERLAAVRREPSAEVIRKLAPAFREGYLNREGKAGQFAYDRIQQALYATIDPQKRLHIHHEIGTLLEQIQIEHHDLIFETVRHLNTARSIVSSEKATSLAQLNLEAGKLARQSTAYPLAIQCFESGIALLGQDAWELHYDLTYHLYLQLASCEFIVQDDRSAKIYFSDLLNNAKKDIEKAEIYSAYISVLAYNDELNESVNIGIIALRELGIEISSGDIDNKIENEFRIARRYFKELELSNGTQKALNIHELNNEFKKSIFNLLGETCGAAYYSSTGTGFDIFILITLKMVNLSFQDGHSWSSVFAYSNFSTILISRWQDYDTAYQIANLAEDLAIRYGNIFVLARTYYILASLVFPWKKPTKDNLILLEQAQVWALEAGDLNYATSAAALIGVTAFYIGHSLDQVRQKAAQYGPFLISVNTGAYNTLNLLNQVAKCLQGETYGPTDLSDRELDEAGFEAQCRRYPKMHISHRYWSLKALLHFLYGDMDEALVAIGYCERLREERVALGMQIHAENMYLHSLILLHYYGSMGLDAYAAQMLDRNFIQMKLWSEHNPHNYLHQYLLIQAEWQRVQGNTLEAFSLYEQAYRAVKETPNLKDQAIILECAARFYLSQGSNLIARAYFKESHYCYTRWGAKRKAQHLQSMFPQFLSTPDSNLSDSVHNTEGAFHHTLTSAMTNSALDLQSIVRASQTISEQIKLDSLLENLMILLLKMASADRGFLFLKSDQGLIPRVFQEGITNTPVLDPTEASYDFAKSVVYYVQQTLDNVVLHDAFGDGNFSKDPYINRQQVKSIVCAPLINKGQMIGILYLENNATKYAFTAQRIEILQILSSQIAISIENATLYANLEKKVEERTTDLKKAYEELKISEERIRHMAYHDSLTGLANRKLFGDRLEQSISRSRRKQESIGVMFVDLDGFKLVNDTYGHEAGDEVLRVMSRRMTQALRESDTVGRLGGDEFAIVLVDLKNDGDEAIVARRILSVVREPVIFKGVGLYVGCSIGISVYPRDGDNIEVLLKQADHAMYQAKQSGKNRFSIYGSQSMED
ncbi:MAG: diguanylate cyclase [Deinococcaceae bacterium]